MKILTRHLHSSHPRLFFQSSCVVSRGTRSARQTWFIATLFRAREFPREPCQWSKVDVHTLPSAVPLFRRGAKRRVSVTRKYRCVSQPNFSALSHVENRNYEFDGPDTHPTFVAMRRIWYLQKWRSSRSIFVFFFLIFENLYEVLSKILFFVTSYSARIIKKKKNLENLQIFNFG